MLLRTSQPAKPALKTLTHSTITKHNAQLVQVQLIHARIQLLSSKTDTGDRVERLMKFLNATPASIAAWSTPSTPKTEFAKKVTILLKHS
jgi:hypothetical protein